MPSEKKCKKAGNGLIPHIWVDMADAAVKQVNMKHLDLMLIMHISISAVQITSQLFNSYWIFNHFSSRTLFLKALKCQPMCVCSAIHPKFTKITHPYTQNIESLIFQCWTTLCKRVLYSFSNFEKYLNDIVMLGFVSILSLLCECFLRNVFIPFWFFFSVFHYSKRDCVPCSK